MYRSCLFFVPANRSIFSFIHLYCFIDCYYFVHTKYCVYIWLYIVRDSHLINTLLVFLTSVNLRSLYILFDERFSPSDWGKQLSQRKRGYLSATFFIQPKSHYIMHYVVRWEIPVHRQQHGFFWSRLGSHLFIKNAISNVWY